MKSLIGKIIENYKILEILGKGGMGTVYKALDIRLERLVVLKMINPQLAQDKTFLERFLVESKLHAKLESPYIVKVFAFLETPAGFFIVMEYIDGVTLADRIKQTGAIDWQQALPMFKKMISAIDHAHRARVIHRDIKPRNVLLNKFGDVKVTDFGLAKFQQAADITKTHTVAGTPKYMPPEQVKGLKNMDFRSDVYSLGMTFYEMLAGLVPFQNDAGEYEILKTIVEKQLPSPKYFNAGIPQPLSDFVMKTLEKDPANRFQNTQEMMFALEKFEEGIELNGSSYYRKNDDATTINLLNTSHAPAEESHTFSHTLTNLLAAKRILGVLSGLVLLVTLIFFIKFSFSNAGSDAGSGGLLIIESAPPGADVFINETHAGKTPFARPEMAAGTYAIGLELAGFKQRKFKEVNVDAGKTTTLSDTLQPEIQLGEVNIQTVPPDAEIWINSQLVGSGNFLDSLPGGEYWVQAKLAGFKDWEETIEIRPDETINITAELGPASFAGGRAASIIFKTVPPGEISIQGNRFKSGTRTSLPPGDYQAVFKHPDYGSHSARISITTDQKPPLTYYFENHISIQSLTESGDPKSALILVNGNPIDYWTPLDRYPLGPGRHRITVQRQGYETEKAEQIINIQPGFEYHNHRLVFTLIKR